MGTPELFRRGSLKLPRRFFIIYMLVLVALAIYLFLLWLGVPVYSGIAILTLATLELGMTVAAVVLSGRSH
jgi:hypothetical protein